MSFPSPADGSRRSFQNIVISNYLGFRTMDRVHKTNGSVCCTPTSDHFTLHFYILRSHKWPIFRHQEVQSTSRNSVWPIFSLFSHLPKHFLSGFTAFKSSTKSYFFHTKYTLPPPHLPWLLYFNITLWWVYILLSPCDTSLWVSFRFLVRKAKYSTHLPLLRHA